jgi:hypothetical protein
MFYQYMLLIRIRMDTYQRIKQDPDQHQSQNSGAEEAKKWSHGGPLTLAMEAWRIKKERVPSYSYGRRLASYRWEAESGSGSKCKGEIRIRNSALGRY